MAHATRGTMVESVHHGHLAAVSPAGDVLFSRGDPNAEIYARSALKPLQAVAMLRSGLDLEPELLALACASHSGEERHLAGVRRILATADLDETVLQNTPDYPYDPAVAIAWRAAGGEPTRLVQNCSGKHAAMVVTSVGRGWNAGDYLEPSHPLQQQVRQAVIDLTGDEPAHETVDGCGAPLFSCSVAGLARAFGRLAGAPEGTPEHRVAAAMNAFGEMVGGTGRDATRLMAAVPGLVAKDGAEGVFAVGLPDGRGIALKVLDGSDRARPVVIAAALRALGVESPVLDELSQVPVLGHGHPVGVLSAVFETGEE